MTAALAETEGERTPLELVGEVALIQAIAGEIADDRVATARAQGLSWHAIAQQLGITRQAAHKRFGKATKAPRKRSAGTRIELRIERGKR